MDVEDGALPECVRSAGAFPGRQDRSGHQHQHVLEGRSGEVSLEHRVPLLSTGGISDR